ncbi:DUF6683 family protein [Pleomorphomonas oryzae]|uniref:DUF6683 family protein n=1 Tax=Pleomorphomonas oryzae TaxID=261934 RepID=UPI00041DC480|nr:DUF6683 family protein [Pleomorphomonas oryzae]
MTLRFARFKSLAMALALLTLAAPATAQDMPTALPNNYVLSDILNRQRVETAIGTDRSTDPSAGSSARREAPVRVITKYHASREVSARVRRQFAEWMSGLAGAPGGRRIAASMRDSDPVRSWARIVGDDELKPGDMADAVTAYWILNWVMANDADSTRDEAQGVRRQVRRMMASSPGYGRLKEAQRQEISEVLMLNFLIQHAAFTDAKARGDSETIDRLGQAAVARFKTEMGVDLNGLRLTDAGFMLIRQDATGATGATSATAP